MRVKILLRLISRSLYPIAPQTRSQRNQPQRQNQQRRLDGEGARARGDESIARQECGDGGDRLTVDNRGYQESPTTI
ncbi:hypothetical protein QUA62_24070 [Microcoleus sp. MON1_C1]|uniref:hypothetical protein n=1 Tax=Microcoleus sp. MON1_C1 TaxID=2818827 RepID=UPI002FD09A2C